MLDLTRIPLAIRLASLGYLFRSWLQRKSKEARRIESARTEFYDHIWRTAADSIGGHCSELTRGILEITKGEVRTHVRCNYTSLDDVLKLRLVGDKQFVQDRLQSLNLPVPSHQEFSTRTLDDAIAFQRKIDGPCVVKPARGTGAGHGITTNVTTRSRLGWAAAVASRYCRDLLIEEQVAGENYRLLYLDGVLLDAVRRSPPTVIGDGQSTIRQLIHQENQCRQDSGWGRSQVLLTIDGDMKFTLAGQKLKLSSVPPNGQSIELKTVINENSADENSSVTDQVCPAIVQAGAAAAREFDVRLAGVDLITPDISKPLNESGGVILEVNTTPGLYHHMRNGQCPVARQILETMLRNQMASLKDILIT